MSAGTRRIPLEDVPRVEAWIRARFQLGPEALLVGSARRKRITVGDIEFVAPMPVECVDAKSPHPSLDPLYEAMLAVTNVPPDKHGKPPHDPAKPFRVVKGLKPGFKYCQVLGRAKSGGEIKVEVYRYVPVCEASEYKTNQGWLTLVRTGPGEFGEWMIGRWKKVKGIASSSLGGKGSEGGFLLDAQGRPVSTPTEQDVFDGADMAAVPPEERDAWIEHQKRTTGWRPSRPTPTEGVTT